MNSGNIIFVPIYRQVHSNPQPPGWPERVPGTCPTGRDHHNCPGLPSQWQRSAGCRDLPPVWKIPHDYYNCWKPTGI